jgi:hypothetical protein
MALAPFSPIVRMLLTPLLLAIFLVVAIVWIKHQLLPLPEPPSFPLAGLIGTVLLMLYTGIGLKRFAAMGACEGAHGFSSAAEETISEENPDKSNRKCNRKGRKRNLLPQIGEEKAGIKSAGIGSFSHRKNWYPFSAEITFDDDGMKPSGQVRRELVRRIQADIGCPSGKRA